MNIRKLLVTAALAALIAGPAYAQGVKYLGASNEKGIGTTGVLGFNALCRATFPGSHFCTTRDILESGDEVSANFAVQWVHPVIVGVTTVGTDVIAVELSGVHSDPLDLSCDA